MKRALALVERDMRKFRRSPALIFASLVMPLVQLIILGNAFGGNIKNVIMGVVNLSADSWYRESVCLSADSAIQRGKVLAAQGAQIIDVGAESTLAYLAAAYAMAEREGA